MKICRDVKRHTVYKCDKIRKKASNVGRGARSFPDMENILFAVT